MPPSAAGAARRPPFRADQVGSLLRPEILKRARETLLGPQTPDQHLGPHGNAELRAVEDQCIRDAVAMQERVGLRAVTDGEFRRRSWWLELIMNWEGFAATRQGASPFKWHDPAGGEQAFSLLYLAGKIRWRPSTIVPAFAFLKANTRAVPKVTLPAPCVVHCYCGGDAAIRQSPYRDPEAFWADLVAAYRQELAALVAAGARYIQLDDTAIAFLCDRDYR